MRAAVVAVVALAAAATGAGAAGGAGLPLVPQQEGEFCSTAPDGVDQRIAAAVDALSVSVGDTGPIAILDTGVDGAVPELGNRFVAPLDATSASGDGSDVEGHGTEVAGIAAGADGLVQGVSPTSPIMPIRVYSRTGATTAQWLAVGIQWAVTHGAAVINISSAADPGDVTAADTAALSRGIDEAFSKGVVVVAAIGNSGNSQPMIPASLPHVLAVGGSDLTGLRAAFSNTGPWVDLVAPATSLVAPIPRAACESGYGVANGTSYAAPAVSAAAAIVARMRPELGPQQRFDVIRTSARDVAPAGRDDETGFGLLDVAAALAKPAPARESSPEADDDPFWVRGPNATGHPVLLTTAKRVTITGQVSPAKDPADVYPVRLKKGERLNVSAKVAGADSLIALGLWKPSVGDFDVTNDVGKQEVVSTGGFSTDPALKMVARSSGVYYLSVEAADVETDDPTVVNPASEPYRVQATKTKPPTKKPKRKPRKKKR